jgi:tRNA threonylcarbamoyladenosine biosynthesis protein TsaE
MRDSGIFKLSRVSKSSQETFAMAKSLAPLLHPGDVLALEGDLGSGKTVFVQGLSAGLKVKEPSEVRSPTFSLIHEYSGPVPLCHADLYRLKEKETLGLGLEEYWQDKEWVVARGVGRPLAQTPS